MARKKLTKITNDQRFNYKEALDDFLRWKSAQGRSKRSIKDYEYHVEKFFRVYPEAENMEELKKHTLSYLAIDSSPVYYNMKLIHLRAFFDFCLSEEYLSGKNPLAELKRKKTESRIVHIEKDTVRALLILPNQTTFAGLRDYTLILVQLDTGIRPKEAVNLLPVDINTRSGEIGVTLSSWDSATSGSFFG